MITRRQFLGSIAVGGAALAAPSLIIGANLDAPVAPGTKPLMLLSNVWSSDPNDVWVKHFGDNDIRFPPAWATQEVEFKRDKFGEMLYRREFPVMEDCQVYGVVIMLPGDAGRAKHLFVNGSRYLVRDDIITVSVAMAGVQFQ